VAIKYYMYLCTQKNVMIVIVDSYKCEYASVQELETYSHLDTQIQGFRYGTDEILFKDQQIKIVTSHIGRDCNVYTNYFSLKTDIDLSKIKYWTILDSPRCAKIVLKDSIVPGMLMTITSDGYGAVLTFFPMSLCCKWSNSTRSEFYDENYKSLYKLFEDYELKWKERPFSRIYSLFKKGGKIALLIRKSQREDGMILYQRYIHIW